MIVQELKLILHTKNLLEKTVQELKLLKVNSALTAQLEITIQSAFGAAQFIDFTLVAYKSMFSNKKKVHCFQKHRFQIAIL